METATHCNVEITENPSANATLEARSDNLILMQSSPSKGGSVESLYRGIVGGIGEPSQADP